MARKGKRSIHLLKPTDIATLGCGKYCDGGGLWVIIRPNRSGYFEFRWMRSRKPRSIFLGSLLIGQSLDDSLNEARNQAHEYRQMLRQGKDPKEARAEKQRSNPEVASTFQQDAEDWFKAKEAGWDPETAKKVRGLLQNHVYGVVIQDGRRFGAIPSGQVDTAVVLQILTPIWGTMNPTARKVRHRIEQILNSSKIKGHRSGDNPARWKDHLEMSGLPKPSQLHKTRHHASLHYSKVPSYLGAIRRDNCISAAALGLVIHGPGPRIEAVVSAEWEEFKPENTPEGVRFADRRLIPAGSMKSENEINFPDEMYPQPLTAPMIEILERMYKIRQSKYVFPGRRAGQHVSQQAVLQFAKRLAKKLATAPLTTHGFRSTFESWSDDRTICEDMVKEMCMGHSVGKDETEKAYRRADLFTKRRLLMEAWSEYLETGRDVAVNINERFMQHMNGNSQVEAASTAAASAQPIANGGVDPHLSRIVIIDIEASGLGSASFPTEIGWAMFREDGSIESGSCLIQPVAKWLRYRNAWSPAAERLTGITKEMLDRDGVSPSEAMSRFWVAVDDRDIFSDAPEFDYHWFCMLAREGGFDFGEDDGAGDFLGDLTRLMDEMSLTVTFGDMPRHRAEADARRLLMGLRSRDTQNGLGRAA